MNSFKVGNKPVKGVSTQPQPRWRAIYGPATMALAALIVLFSALLSIPPGYATAPIKQEKFIYDLRWTGIKAGSASLQLKDEGAFVKILSTARSAPWVSVFYTVEDRVESTLAKNGLETSFVPLRYRVKIREGRHRRDKEIVFNYDRGRAIYTDHLNNEHREIEIMPPVFDPLSGFFYLRTLKLDVGTPVFLTIFDSKKVWNVEVQVLRRERVTTQAGTFDTIVVKPLMKSEGIFSRQGDVIIWLTDDDRRIPVKMQTKVAIGTITAMLVQGVT